MRFVLLLFLALLTLSSPAERIREYRSIHRLHHDGSLTLEETIRYDFGSQSLHGIYRELPLSYRPSPDSKAVPVEITVRSVRMDGRELPWHTERFRRRGTPWLRLKIGDPRHKISGTHRYTLTLHLDPALIPQIEGERAYWRWNLLGTGWQVPIGKFTGILTLPSPLERDSVVLRGYYGPYGSRSPLLLSPGWEGAQRLKVVRENIPPGYGITLECECRSDILKSLGAHRTLPAAIGWGALPWWLMGAVSLLVLTFAGFHRQKTSTPHKAVPVRYRPPEEVTLLQAQRILSPYDKSPALFAALTELAQKGALRLHHPTESAPLVLEKIKGFDSRTLEEDQRFLLETLPFSPDENRLELQKGLLNRETEVSQTLQNLVEKILIKKGIFHEAAGSIRRKYWKGALLIALPVLGALLYEGYRRYGIEGLFPSLMLLGFLLLGFKLLLDSRRKASLSGTLFALVWLGGTGWALIQLPAFTTLEALLRGPLPWIALILGGLLYRAGRLSPLSEKGRELHAELLGYREFLSRVESAPMRKILQEDPEALPRGIPYALLFGLLPGWIRAYRELNTEPPSWYDGPWEGFEPAMADAANALDTPASHPSDTFDSGGGGFSGGGGGGGGGGSW